MSIFSVIAKRQAYPIEINGGTIHVCEPTFSEIDRVRNLTGEQTTGLSLALCCVDANGEKLFPKQDGETDAALADRVLVEAADLTVSTVQAIMAAIQKLTKPASVEKIEKN